MSPKYIKRFLCAIWKDWIALMSGIASVLLGAYGAASQANLPPWAFWCAAAICLCVAMYRAFLSEAKKSDEFANALNDKQRYFAIRQQLGGYIAKAKEFRHQILGSDAEVPQWIDEVKVWRRACGQGIAESLSLADAQRVFCFPSLIMAHAMNAKNEEHNRQLLELDMILRGLQSLFDQIPRF